MAQNMAHVTSSELRKVIRLLVSHYAKPRSASNYDVFMRASSVMWFLRGRPGLTLAEQAELVNGALGDLEYLVDMDPTVDDLLRAQSACRELAERIDNRISSAQLLATHDDDFAEWAAELNG